MSFGILASKDFRWYLKHPGFVSQRPFGSKKLDKIKNVELTEEKSEKVETDDSREKHVTVVSLEQQEEAEAVEDSKEQENVKSVRFTSNVIEIGEQQRASRE